jgi:hypothetical protein
MHDSPTRQQGPPLLARRAGIEIRSRTVCRCLLLAVVLFTVALQARAGEFQFKDGDRIALVGSTLIEREQKYGYWELALTTRHPNKNITFRNLGWSGDTVWGESRVGFDLDNPQKGFERLVNAVLAVKPTVIIVGYGTNESFAGEAGLPRFKEGLNKLLDAFVPTKARIAMLAPPMIEEAKWRGRELEQRKQDLEQYTELIRQVAKKRGLTFINEFVQRYGPAETLTDTGIHLTAFGYWNTAGNLMNELRLLKGLEVVELDGLNARELLQEKLPNAPVPPGRKAFQADSVVIARNLRAGKYTLKIDGKGVQTEDADAWMKPPLAVGVFVLRGPSLDQAEKLRQLIIEKNQLFFHRYRPQNETYLFGFRRYEQGNNAVEVPQFDALIEAKEKEIAKLRVPVKHTYELVPVK